MESTTYLEPTIIARRDDEGKEGVAFVGGQNALIVFRSKDEVEEEATEEQRDFALRKVRARHYFTPTSSSMTIY